MTMKFQPQMISFSATLIVFTAAAGARAERPTPPARGPVAAPAGVVVQRAREIGPDWKALERQAQKRGLSVAGARTPPPGQPGPAERIDVASACQAHAALTFSCLQAVCPTGAAASTVFEEIRSSCLAAAAADPTHVRTLARPGAVCESPAIERAVETLVSGRGDGPLGLLESFCEAPWKQQPDLCLEACSRERACETDTYAAASGSGERMCRLECLLTTDDVDLEGFRCSSRTTSCEALDLCR
jgi:hypothetical protein